MALLAALAACHPRQPVAETGTPTHTASSTRTHPVTPSSPGRTVPTVTICGAGPEIRPARLVLACADGNSVVRHISWTSWSTTSAHGKGTEWWDDCVPAYRCGLNAHRPASVVLSRAAGGRFTRMRVYTGGRVLAYDLPD